MHGHGSIPTAAAFRKGYRWSLVKMWLTETRSLEYALQRSIPGQRMCPVCSAWFHPEEQLLPKFEAVSFDVRKPDNEKRPKP